MALKYFYLKDGSKETIKDGAKKTSSIVAIIRFKGKRYKISTGETVLIDKWLPKEKKASAGRSYPDGVFINETLESLEFLIDKTLQRFKLDTVAPSLQDFKKAMDEERTGGVQNDVYLTSDIQKRIEVYTESRSDSTIKKYTTTLHKLIEFEKYRKSKLRFSDIDIQFYYDFKTWFYHQKKDDDSSFSKNYFGSIVKNIKKFMNDGLKDGIHNYTGHKHPDFKTDSEEADTIYLNEDELNRIYDLKITEEKVKGIYPKMYAQNLMRKMKSMEQARKRFLIGAYTLLRVSDYKRLSEINLQENFIRMKPKKRAKGKKNRDVVIPIHPRVKEILKEMDWDYHMPEQKINDRIKEICRLADIKEKVFIVRTEADKEVERVYEKWELVCTHTARRSAATNMLLAGMKASDIMGLGNWASEKSFWKYIRMSPEINAKRLMEHPFFK